jgi:hypothetical protein
VSFKSDCNFALRVSAFVALSLKLGTGVGEANETAILGREKIVHSLIAFASEVVLVQMYPHLYHYFSEKTFRGDNALSRLLPLLEPRSRAISSIRLSVVLFGLKDLLFCQEEI